MATDKIIDTYRRVYNLSELEYEEEVTEDFFRFCNKKHYFTIISIYNLKKEIFLIRDFNKYIGWELPGGYVNNEESIENTVNRIVLTETGLEIDELSPVVIVKNVFKCKNKKSIHYGIAFMALSRGKIKPYLQNFQTCFTQEIPSKTAYQNDKIIRLVKNKLYGQKYKPPFEEIESVKTKNFSLLYFFHKYLIKHIGNFSSIKIKESIFNLIEGSPQTILDASCGDSSIINDLCRKYNPETCIGNDISWKTITLMKNKNKKVIFTNHNVLDLPYNLKFDLVVFKNTLHHIEKKYQKKLLIDLKSRAKQLIVVDINDPQNSSFLSKIWNKYYVYLLGDQGESFLTFDEFKEIAKIKKFSFKSGLISTIKGDYFYASITD